MVPRDIVRRVRLGDVKRVFRARWGPELPNDDAGEDDLVILLALTDPRNWNNVTEVWAPWMSAAKAEEIKQHVATTKIDVSPLALGLRVRLTMEERERLGVRQIAPCDVTKEELKEHRKMKERDRARKRRRRVGAVSREAYLSQSLSRLKPWIVEGISRSAWYQRKAGQVHPQAWTSPTTINSLTDGRTRPRKPRPPKKRALA